MKFTFNLKQVILLILSITSVIALIFCSLTLFSSPSWNKNTDNYLIELNTTNANISTIFPINQRPGTDHIVIQLESYYRFGLWGYCSGTYPLTSSGEVISTDFIKIDCSPKEARYTPDIADLLMFSYSFNDFNVYPRVNGFENADFSKGFNGILAAFVISVILLFLTLYVMVLSFFSGASQNLEFFSWVVLIAISLGQWIPLVVGLTALKQSYDLLYDFIVIDNSIWGLGATLNYRIITYGWCAMAFGVAGFLVACIGAFYCYRSAKTSKNDQKDPENKKESATDEN